MWLQVLKFELKYRSSRPATYIYFAIIFALCMLAVTTDMIQIGGASGMVKENAPSVIATIMVVLTAVLTVISSAVMGVPVLRDFEHKSEALMFTTPLKKFDYLLGRFLGSYLILAFIFAAMPLAFIIGEFMPGRDAEKLLPFNAMVYLNPFLIIVLPNLLFSGAIFFAAGTLSRQMMLVYLQGILLFVGYSISLSLIRDIENANISAIIDPFGIRTLNVLTRYWSVAEQNTLPIPLEGIMLYNRLLWLGIGLILLILTFWLFGFSARKRKAKNIVRISKEEQAKRAARAAAAVIPKAKIELGWGTNFKIIFRQIAFYFGQITKDAIFWGIVICGILILAVNTYNMGRTFGANTYPTTYLMIEQISGFTLFFIIILVFYSGELIWKERGLKINQIYDATPIPDAVNLISKFFSLIAIFVMLMFTLILTGVVAQILKGYYQFELGLYFSSLFYGTFPTLVLFTMLAFFLHVMVNHKFLGHALMIIFFVATGVLSYIGVEHSLLIFGSGSLGIYSDMNGFGHYPTSYNWYNLYWTAFSILLFATAVVLSVRGTESSFLTRLKIGKMRLKRPVITFGIASLLTFALSGCYIYYNTNVLNEYTNSDTAEELRANYEKTLKKYQGIVQPKIADVYLEVDLYPYDRDYKATGYFILENKSDENIAEVHIQLAGDDKVETNIEFEGGATVSEEWEEFGYTIYKLNKPLSPGDRVKMNLDQQFTTKGFVESGDNTSVVYNGTFFNSGQFPTLGYSEGFELSSDDDRKEYDLEPKQRLPERNDRIGLSNNFFTDDANQISFEIKVTTDSSQIAIAPGYLQSEATEGNRRTFHYKMDVPMVNFYNVVSAEYEVMRDKWVPKNDSLDTEVNLEIYYHKGHEYNLDRMMKAMKQSFDYYSENFSPYQFRQMRILEFPRYASFAQSFANTVPFSEGIGFMLEIDEEDDTDPVFFVTAHELAHQWWGHQLLAANVQGSQVLSESLSQYSALMVMQEEYPDELVREFLKEEQQRYLRGRTSESKREMPLETVENQSYIHYGKGALVFYALQDYIGADSVNAALARFLDDWSIIDGKRIGERFPTTLDLLPELRAVTPDSLQYLITDMFERIVFYENKTEKAEYTALSDNEFEVTIAYEAQKFEADTIGNETDIPLNDLIEIGVFGKDEAGEDKLLYLQKHRLNAKEGEVTIVVEGQPYKAGIDPLYKLIDRNLDDNVKSVSQKEAS